MNRRTRDAALRQAVAMGCARYRIGIFDASGGLFEPRVVDVAGLEAMLPMLAARNVGGANVYIEPDPAEPHGLVLVDDVDMVTVEEMDAAGFAARVVVETSFKNCQAWLGFKRALSGGERAAIGRMLALRFGADAMCAATRHMGRLAGFTNRKPARIIDGRPQFVLLRRALTKAQLIAVPKGLTSPQDGPRAVLMGKVRVGDADALSRHVSVLHARLRERFGERYDASRADFACVRMLAGFDDATIAAALEAGSPGLAERHPGMAEYVARTIRAARR